MKPVNLLKKANFTKDGPMMEMVHDSEQAREVLFSVGKGQEDPAALERVSRQPFGAQREGNIPGGRDRTSGGDRRHCRL